MIYLGIDWATDKHDVCVVAEDGRILSEFQIPHDLAGFERLREQVQPLGPVKVNIERADGLLVEWMLVQGYHVHVTPPNVVAHRRPHHSKDDRGDAYLLAYLLRVGDPDTRPVVRPSEAAVALRQLAATYDMLLHEQRQLTNRMIYTLRQYYPAMLKLFSIPNSLICLAFLEAYPTPTAARALSRSDLAAFLRSQHYTRLDHLSDMYALLQSPAPQAAVIAGHLAALRLLIPTLRLLHLERTRLTKQIQLPSRRIQTQLGCSPSPVQRVH